MFSLGFLDIFFCFPVLFQNNSKDHFAWFPWLEKKVKFTGSRHLVGSLASYRVCLWMSWNQGQYNSIKLPGSQVILLTDFFPVQFSIFLPDDPKPLALSLFWWMNLKHDENRKRNWPRCRRRAAPSGGGGPLAAGSPHPAEAACPCRHLSRGTRSPSWEQQPMRIQAWKIARTNRNPGLKLVWCTNFDTHKFPVLKTHQPDFLVPVVVFKFLGTGISDWEPKLSLMWFLGQKQQRCLFPFLCFVCDFFFFF